MKNYESLSAHDQAGQWDMVVWERQFSCDMFMRMKWQRNLILKKKWACVSNNCDVKKKKKNMLVCLKNERSRLDESLDALQNSLRTEIMPKKKMTFERRRRTGISVNGRRSSPLWLMGKMGLEENECLQHLNSHAFANTA
ncbi:hypothetical protein IEQ34_016886 [Dendrobium chrysotoxum]|uniref:Uncharacterized protein n=1 Tax=Dendrobium chrysotoxum TaxID=161865 RepID=A0AAV7GFH5_DENCH|nr:hypothetical protein IEQ34_016886 [Dendrobium chrysotoxum]